MATAAAGFGALAVGHVLVHDGVAPALWLPALLGYLAVSAGVAALLIRHFPYDELGWCNVVTQARLAMVALLVTPLVAVGAGTGEGPAVAGGWAAMAVALAALALDGVDGWLARRQGLCSPFGARFDMEVDAGLALVLALHALAAGAAGPAVLVLGLARYAFVAATGLWPWLGGALPERFSRKAVCVAQLSVLILLQVPGLPGAAAEGLAVMAALALAWSFGKDVAWLRRTRPGTAERARA
ncbi:CDP-alcohol phosphatidyltransferase family protein [Rhodovulum sp. 12E13]|uniref:CDP-alcohol phosphatidyltransferase family protein n=1 Tax=Rhodovulum sp. 12E13 TaxID=2203891 RepID=UPI001314A41C|nr:CDP-alcohol phosphatidyltransferase family protein [Rhodovulum sp. 12E13]